MILLRVPLLPLDNLANQMLPFRWSLYDSRLLAGRKGPLCCGWIPSVGRMDNRQPYTTQYFFQLCE